MDPHNLLHPGKMDCDGRDRRRKPPAKSYRPNTGAKKPLRPRPKSRAPLGQRPTGHLSRRKSIRMRRGRAASGLGRPARAQTLDKIVYSHVLARRRPSWRGWPVPLQAAATASIAARPRRVGAVRGGARNRRISTPNSSRSLDISSRTGFSAFPSRARTCRASRSRRSSRRPARALLSHWATPGILASAIRHAGGAKGQYLSVATPRGPPATCSGSRRNTATPDEQSAAYPFTTTLRIPLDKTLTQHGCSPASRSR